MKIYVFLSYGHDEYSERTQLLYEQLIKDNDNFIIWWDKELRASDNWVEEIERHLDDLIGKRPDSCFLYVVTPYSSNTDRDNFCIKEIAKAIGGKVRVIPVKLIDAPLPLLLSNIQWLDFTDVSLDPDNLEFQRRMEQLCSIIKEGQKMQTNGKQEVLQKLLEPCNFSLDLEKHLANYVERPWLLNGVYQWIETTDDHILLILGGPGTGKTAFSIWMSYCKLSHYIGAWHLCQYSDKRTCSLRNAVKSIVYYLSARMPAYYALLDVGSVDKILNENDFDAGTLFKELILEKLHQIHYTESKLVILVDALDEASTNHHNELAEMLARYVDQLPKWLKFIITSRNDDSVTSYLEDSSTIINLDDNKSIQQSKWDIRSYVKERIGEERPIIEFIIAESGNNFLYAQLLCNNLIENKEERLNRLPKGINNYYHEYIRRYFSNNRFDFDEHARPLLQLILTSYEPLDKELLWKRMRKICPWCNRYAVFNDLIRCFGPLLNESCDTLLPFHKSLSDWFFDHKLNKEYCVFRKDGLEEMINWGLEVVNTDDNYADDVMLSHFYRYLPQYLIEAGDYRSLTTLYVDLNFWEHRQSKFGVNLLLNLMMNELAQYSTHQRELLFKDQRFFKVLDYFNIDFFNTGRYKSLWQLGYQIQIESGMEDESRLFCIRYYYINEQYDEIDRFVKIFEEPYENHVIEAMLMNELGQTYRKFGQLARSAYYYEKSLDGAIKYSGTEDEIIYTMLNLSRIFMLQRKDQEARQLLKKAVERYDKGQWCTSMLGSDFEFSAQQLTRGVRYVELEMEMYSLYIDNTICMQSLQWADSVYANPIKRDRYYANHLISKLLYKLRIGDIQGFEELSEECANCGLGEYDSIRYTIVKALYALWQGFQEEARLIAEEQLIILCKRHIHAIQRTELSAIIDFISGQTSVIVAEMHPWYLHFLQIIQQLLDNRKV